jgi:hypothetical protein
MRFVDERGRILNIYQQLTQLADDHLLDARFGGQEWGGQAKVSAESALVVAQTLLRRSTTDHCVICANYHPDLFYVAPFAADQNSRTQAERLLEGTLDYAVGQGIPIWSALQWLQFTEVRHNVNLEEVRWQPESQRLSFRLAAQAAPEVELAVMVPLQHGSANVAQVEVDGQPVEHRTRVVGGVAYGWVAIGADSHQVAVTYG